jgi:hypothetical protein
VLVATVVDAELPVVEDPVVTPVFDAEVNTPLAPAAEPVVPRVALLVPLPKGSLSRNSGTLKVVVPSPTP